MNKRLFWFSLFLIVLLVGTINYSDTIQKPFLQFFNNFKIKYTNITETISHTIEEHFFQVETIKELKKKLQQCDKNRITYHAIQTQLNQLQKLYDANLSSQPDIQLTRAIAYQNFGDTNRVWLDMQDFNSSKIYGLIYKEYVAGIAVAKNDMPLAILNRDPKCSYAVSIGKEKAPGIAHGNNEKNIVVTFIPSWYNIEIGDEIVTSGLDNIFFQGLKVGKVLSISMSQGYKKAIVKPYYTPHGLDYFYIITKVR
jgi:rod shape-determining protein MreC